MRKFHLSSTSSEYECHDCDLTFKFHKEFNNHHRLLDGKCKIGRNKTRTRFSTNPKTKSASVVNTFECPKCNLEFRTITILRRHFAQHLKNNPFKCIVKGCSSIAFGDYYFLKRHVFKKHCKPDKPFRCENPIHPSCYLNFTTVYYLHKHLYIYHPGEAVPNVLQDVSKKNKDRMLLSSYIPPEHKLILQFNEALKNDPVVLKLLQNDSKHAEVIDSLNLSSSRAVSKKLFQCEQCPYSTKMSIYFNKHMKSFHGKELDEDNQEDDEDNHVDDDNKSADNLSPFEESLQPTISKSVKQIYCLYDRCWHRFTSISERQRHEKNMHGKFSCSKCDFISPSRLALKKHCKITHESKGRILKCTYCGKTFLRAVSLETHTLKHYGENPQKSLCSICGQVYSTIHTLKIHMDAAHGKKMPQPEISESETSN